LVSGKIFPKDIRVMIEKLVEIKNRFEEVELLLVQPETVKDQKDSNS